MSGDMFRSAFYAFVAGALWGLASVSNDAEWRQALAAGLIHGLIGLLAWLSLATLVSSLADLVREQQSEDEETADVG